MIEDIKLITQNEIDENGVCASPTVLTGTPEENKKIFDKLCTEVIIPKLNSLISESTILEKTLSSADTLSKENREYIENVIKSLGDISALDISGEDLCKKVESLKNSFSQSMIDLILTIGPMKNLKYFSSSVVNALNYLYDMISPGAISVIPVLPQASEENLMQIFRVFDVGTKEHKLYICKAAFPKETGISEGQLCERIYFDPHASYERYSSFCKTHYNDFVSAGTKKLCLNIMSFVSQQDENDVCYMQIRYSTSLDGYVLAFCKNDVYTDIWASKNFSMDSKDHVEGYTSKTYTDIFADYIIKEIPYDLSWLVNSKEFSPNYYWEELGEGVDLSGISLSKNGKYSTLTITEGQEVRSVVIEDGADGYTPIKGVDYFTEADIEEISLTVEENIKKDVLETINISPEFAESTDDCTDTSKIYVLPDGFMYAYMENHLVNSPNMFDLDNGSKLNYRINSSGAETEYAGLVLTDYISVELSDPYTVNISGVTLNDVYGGAFYAVCYDGEKTRLGAKAVYVSGIECGNGVYTLDLYDLIMDTYSATAYVRLVLGIRNETLLSTDEDIKALKIEFVPKNVDEYSYLWTNTGHAFVPADYEAEISDISSRAETNSESISVLEKRMDKIIANEAYYPSIWDDAVSETILKIKELSRPCGRDCVTFAFFSDNHQRLGYFGALIGKIMKKCNIPYVFFGGDSISNGTIASAEAMEDQEMNFFEMTKYINEGRFCRALGNHDGYYLLPTGEKYHYTWDEKYNLFMAPIGVSQNKVFGGDGTYYYVDDLPSKTRFIVLNSVWFNYKTNDDGTINNSDGLGFGNEQITWLKDVLLNTSDDYGVVFVSHSPITNNYHSNLRDAYIVQGIVNAFIAGESYEGEYTVGEDEGNHVSVSVEFNKKGTVYGWFAGHIHRDLILTEDSNTENPLLFKTVTITSDANMSYDDLEDERNMDGDTSHAIDFVTVNKRNGEVYITRLGVGEDRTYNYMEE